MMSFYDTPRLDLYYERELEKYDDEMDMCNQLGIDIDEIYIYDDSDIMEEM